jgi:hypothetical protein
MAIGHTFQDVLEVGQRLYVVELCGGQQRGDDRPAYRAAVGSGEQVVLAAKRDRADGALDRVGVEFDTPVIEEAAKSVPTRQRIADTDDPLYAVSDRILVSLISELSRDVATPGSSPISAMLLPQIFEARSARLARLRMANSGLSGVQWFALIALIVSALVVVALVYNNDAGIQVLAMNLCSVAAAVAFFVILAHDRPFVGAISVSPGPLLKLAAKASAEIPRVVDRDRKPSRSTSPVEMLIADRCVCRKLRAPFHRAIQRLGAITSQSSADFMTNIAESSFRHTHSIDSSIDTHQI